MIINIKVKICGITNLDDARAAFEMGADMLGFNFYPESPRYIRPEEAFSIINKLPTFVDSVGLFVNAPIDEIKTLAETGYLNWIQLHGDETPEFCDQVQFANVRTLKAIRVRDEKDVQTANAYYTYAVLLDAFSPDGYGGTGSQFNWQWIKDIPKRLFLAGGITPDNVAEAIRTGVYGIDICSGIESVPGQKDHQKMQKLFDVIRYTTGLKARQ
ncbi:MAG TPA: phosphoribosylanthranilate isomerase [Phycisphaerales bacterium]|nr:phosphoribosylanthranilate isomerase [Phycisphaerales bacterium]